MRLKLLIIAAALASASIAKKRTKGPLPSRSEVWKVAMESILEDLPSISQFKSTIPRLSSSDSSDFDTLTCD